MNCVWKWCVFHGVMFFGPYASQLIGCDGYRRALCLSATARVSVQKPVTPVIPAMSPAMAVAPAAVLARSKAVRVIQPPVVRGGLSSIVSPDTVTTMVRVPSRIGYTG